MMVQGGSSGDLLKCYFLKKSRHADLELIRLMAKNKKCWEELAPLGKVTADLIENQEGQWPIISEVLIDCVHKIQIVGGRKACMRKYHPTSQCLPGLSNKGIMWTTWVILRFLVATFVTCKKKQVKLILTIHHFDTNISRMLSFQLIVKI